MPDRNTFIATIIAHPDEDGPRLVYAGWLEQYGDEKDQERAEFVLVQIELAKLDAMSFAGCAACEIDGLRRHDLDCPHNPAHPLRRRERELLERHALEWTDDVRRFWPHVNFWLASDNSVNGSAHDNTPNRSRGITRLEFAFRRGFVDEIACSWQAWGGGACRICRTLGHVGRIDDDGPHPACRDCSGTGRVAGQAAELLKAAPIRKVRLTWWTAEEATERRTRDGLIRECRIRGRDRWHQVPYVEADRLDYASVLTAEWPGIAFELPTNGPSPMRGAYSAYRLAEDAGLHRRP